LFVRNFLENNKIILFNLPRRKGKSFYSIYAALLYLHSNKNANNFVNKEIKKILIITPTTNMIFYIKNMLLESIKRHFNDLEIKNVKFNIVLVRYQNFEFKFEFYSSNNIENRLNANSPDLLIFDDYFDFDEKFKSQYPLHMFDAKIILNGVANENDLKYLKNYNVNFLETFHNKIMFKLKMNKIKNKIIQCHKV